MSESVNSHFGSSSSSNMSDPTVTPTQPIIQTASSVCLLQTIFTQPQIDIIFSYSKFGLITANMLWSHLSLPNELASSSSTAVNTNSSSSASSSSSIDKRAAILFCLLHELLPNNLCEDMISSQLLAVDNNNAPVDYYVDSIFMSKECDLFVTSSLPARLDSFKRFARLWHWSRELVSHAESDLAAAGSGSSRSEQVDDMINDISVSTIKFAKMKKTFERSLMIVLNMLTNKDTPVTLVKLIKGIFLPFDNFYLF